MSKLKAAKSIANELLRHTKFIAKLEKEKKPGYKEKIETSKKEFEGFKKGYAKASAYFDKNPNIRTDAELREAFRKILKNDDPKNFYKGGVVDIVDAGKYFKHK